MAVALVALDKLFPEGDDRSQAQVLADYGDAYLVNFSAPSQSRDETVDCQTPDGFGKTARALAWKLKTLEPRGLDGPLRFTTCPFGLPHSTNLALRHDRNHESTHPE